MIGINTLTFQETANRVKQSYVVPTGTTYPVLLQGNTVGATYGTTKEDYLVIGANGVCTLRVHGYNQSAVEKALDEALAATGVKDTPSTKPADFLLDQNYPNPFNSQTVIRFHLSQNGTQMVALKIYDVRGREVVTLTNQHLSPGIYQFPWAGKNNQGQAVTSGVYYYVLTVGTHQEMRKMTLIQ